MTPWLADLAKKQGQLLRKRQSACLAGTDLHGVQRLDDACAAACCIPFLDPDGARVTV